ncbi:hypothetical protein [Tateyamaria pelophila]|uniref:hypothetical protein n=1 Tax=Tateyamaria pelophila TaxID=328415 RepID=UPI001CC1966D|nr:hypothetical protein [Tateyamaria pelophila]
MAGEKDQEKRFWSDEEKVSICVQTCAPGVSVAQVARRFNRHSPRRVSAYDRDKIDLTPEQIRQVALSAEREAS